MPSFKPRGSKTIAVSPKKATTLDSKHTSILREITRREMEDLPKLKTRVKKLKRAIAATTKWCKKSKLKEQLSETQREIKKISKEKTQYYLDNSQILFKYYEQKARQTNSVKSSSNVLNSFFNIGDEKEARNDDSPSDASKYLASIDEKFINIDSLSVPIDVCRHCNGEMVPIDHEGLMVCKNCSRSEQFLIENERPSYKDPPLEVSFYAYKRINHFREIIAQFQAKETTQIPEDIIQTIKKQIKKERITLDQLTNKRAKEILKKLGFNKYYEHIPFIKNKLGIKPPIMSPELEETLCSLFMQIQAPYSKFCPQERVNFLNYYYTVYKLCELLDQTEFLPFFPMLKDREKRIEQDEIWKKICNELSWEFIPTI